MELQNRHHSDVHFLCPEIMTPQSNGWRCSLPVPQNMTRRQSGCWWQLVQSSPLTIVLLIPIFILSTRSLGPITIQFITSVIDIVERLASV